MARSTPHCRREVVPQHGFTLIELMIVVTIVGLLAAIAIPNFLRYQAKSRQAEVKTNLGALFVAETAYFGENARYGSFSETGFKLAGTSNRYTYRSGAPGAGGVSTNTQDVDYFPAGTGPIVAEGSPAANNSATGFTATGAANLDNDATLDQWSVNDIKRDMQTADSNDVSS